MKNFNFTPSDLNYDQIEILKIRNAESQRKENLFFASLAFLVMDAIIIGIIFLYANHYPFESLIPSGKTLFSFAMIAPAIPLKKKGKKEEKTDDANLSKIKDAKKDKGGKDQTRSSIYRGMDALSMKDQKKERSKIRRKLDAFINAILGLDRSKEDKEKSLKEFNAFYKGNWKIQDYKIDNFSNRSDEDQRKDYQKVLDLAKKSLG